VIFSNPGLKLLALEEAPSFLANLNSQFPVHINLAFYDPISRIFSPISVNRPASLCLEVSISRTCNLPGFSRIGSSIRYCAGGLFVGWKELSGLTLRFFFLCLS